jgi:hypothetical protein
VSVQARIGAILGGAVGIVLVIAGMWGWQHAQQLITEAPNPDRALWAVRCAAIGAVAAAQLILLTFVIGGIYERRSNRSGAVRMTADIVFGLALISAVVFAFAGK